MTKVLRMRKLDAEEAKGEATPPSREWARKEIAKIKGVSCPSERLSLEVRKGEGEASKTSPKPLLAPISDTSGNPSESTNHSLLATIKREWMHQLRAHRVVRGAAIYLNPLEPTFTEIIEEETKVRKELYGYES